MRSVGSGTKAWLLSSALLVGCTFVASHAEAALFARLLPDCGARIRGVTSGVDHRHFDPALDHPLAYDSVCPTYVFAGTMDYPPNVEAAAGFARSVLPGVPMRAGYHAFRHLARPAQQAVYKRQTQARRYHQQTHALQRFRLEQRDVRRARQTFDKFLVAHDLHLDCLDHEFEAQENRHSAGERANERRFAGAGCTNEGHHLAPGDREGHIVEHAAAPLNDFDTRRTSITA